MRKRHRYVTVIVNGDTGHTLAMVEHRSSAALSAFLMSQPHKWRRGVKVVVTDGSRAYKASVDACLPQARHVLDRFGVIRWFCAGLTAVRRDVQRREPHGVKPAFDPEVFKARFLLLRRGDTLTGADQTRLDALFDSHSRLEAGWQALQQLHGLYLADETADVTDATTAAEPDTADAAATDPSTWLLRWWLAESYHYGYDSFAFSRTGGLD